MEQLLGPEGRDVEEGKEKRERSWYSLIGTALQHVWPHNLGMQARVLACLVIVSAQRLVNLAVPILCERFLNHPTPPHPTPLHPCSSRPWSLLPNPGSVH